MAYLPLRTSGKRGTLCCHQGCRRTPHFVRIEAPHATKVEGSVHPSQQPALTPEQKEAVKALYKGGKTISQIAEEYHVSPATIHKTIHGGKKGKKGSKKH